MVLAVHEGRTMKNFSFALLAVLVLGAHAAHAQPGAPVPEPSTAPPEKPEEELKTVAITISPVHLAFPMVELTGEFRVGRKLGIAAIVGAGEATDSVSDVTVKVYEFGASARYYLLGNFRHGMQIGGELLYVKANTKDTNIRVSGEGFGVSPFLGYKWQHRSGFTIDTQLGITYIAVRAKAESTNQMEEDSKVGALLNLNVGWSI
jgi:hypothetical protein